VATFHLLHFKPSHYNEKVRWTLDLKKVPHTREALLPGFHIPRVRRLTGQNLTPVLVIDGKAVCGSSRIIGELEKMYPDPPLYPEDAKERERALEIEKYFDEEVAPDLRRIFWSTYFDRKDDCIRMATDGFGSGIRTVWTVALPIMKPIFRKRLGVDAETVRAAIERVRGYFDRLESEIGSSGFLVGDRFTIADLGAASIMSGLVRPPEFAHPLPEPWPPGLIALHENMASHPAFRWVQGIFKKHRPKYGATNDTSTEASTKK
jgi:glutathione S-transferase